MTLASPTTTSDHFRLISGDHVLKVRSAAASGWSATLSESDDGVNFDPLLDGDGNEVVLGPATQKSIRVAGNRCYRLEDVTYDDEDDIVFSSSRCDRL
jgi:hypothetical protein